ncbi:MAG: hypothetical protein INR67_04080 [Jatrophihabitans endophyticus]|nr:hypothetical protein [Jatrophihabitans endophyticus]
MTVYTRTLNQHGKVALSFERVFYVYKKGAARSASLFPEADTPMPEPQQQAAGAPS